MRCRTCRETKTADEFYYKNDGKTRSDPDCKKCRIAKTIERRKLVRAAVIERLGGKCYCCGETDHRFLTIDHKNRDGAAHRRELNNIGGRITTWLDRRPEEDHRFQVACWNCNSGRDINGGVCPHQELDPEGAARG